jgi:predicted HTH domain antitoxin
MPVTIELPPAVEAALRRELPNLDEQAKELLVVSLFREGKLTHHEVSTILGLSRYETDGVLKNHGVVEDVISIDDFESEVQSLAGLPQS